MNPTMNLTNEEMAKTVAEWQQRFEHQAAKLALRERENIQLSMQEGVRDRHRERGKKLRAQLDAAEAKIKSAEAKVVALENAAKELRRSEVYLKSILTMREASAERMLQREKELVAQIEQFQAATI